ncbi:MAG TPA: serine hydrolase domain-containing protein [Microthrixaceae bacterium]|nr:serine hydrolase domain-containing protein [Microthrixaceae bacterium]
MTEIHGHCDEAFTSVRDQFANNFEQGLELGASVCVTKDGKTVVDLWGGDADRNGRPWEQDTLCNVWSTTKTMSAIVMLMLADRGQIDLDAPVADYWPEFKANGKEGVLVRHVLAHTAGLPGWAPPIAVTDLYDQDVLARNFEAQSPWWEPGTKSGYHLISQGHLEAEIVRRVTGQTIGTIFREQVAEPLGAEFHIGLPESEEGKVAELIPPESVGLGELDGTDLDSVAVRAATSCPIKGSEPNTREWRAAEIPAAGGQGNARGVARVHSVLANGGSLDGVELLSEATLERIFEEQSENVDLVLGAKMRMGIGFGLMNETVPLSANRRSCFWGGWGGSIAVIDVDARISIAYVMNKMAPELMGDLRGGTLAILALMANASS